MEKITSLVSLILILFNTNSYCQTFDWAKRAGSYAYDYGRGICADGSGNVYITGEFEYAGNFGGINVNSRGNHDIFIAKYNPYGGIQWVRRAGGNAGDVGHAISSDQNGNVYVSGEFQTTADFGHITLTAASYLNDIFIAKYDKYGNIQWAKRAGGYESDKGLGVADKYGNVYVTGFFTSWATFGSNVIYSNGDKDVFLAKYNTNGTLLWVKRFGSNKKDEGRSISVDNSGNVIVGGYFQGTIAFGSTYLNCSGDHDGFITKFDPNGNVVWARRVNGPYYEVTRGVTTDNAGNVYATGVFCYGTKFENVPLNPYGQGDIFVVSYTPWGSLRWVKRAGSGLFDEGTAIKSDPYGNVFLTGRFSGNAVFGGTVLYGADQNEVFTASLSSGGSWRWALKAGGNYDQGYSYGEPESGLAVTIDNSSNVYTTGAFRTNIAFGSTWLNQYYNTDIFVSKIRQFRAIRSNVTSLEVKQENNDILIETDEHPEFIYHWYKDGVLIPEANNHTLKIEEKAFYQTMIVNGEDSAFSENRFIDPELVVPLASPITNSNLSIYPNPNNGDFTIEISNSNSEKPIYIEVINVTGQVIHKESYAQGSELLSVKLEKELPNGVYFIKAIIDNNIYSGRMILRR